MKTSKVPFILSASFVLIVTSAAYAEPPHGRGGKHQRLSFEELDTDGSGGISFNEFVAAREKRMQKRFERMDTDGDGALSKAEMEDARAKMRDHFKSRRQRRDVE